MSKGVKTIFIIVGILASLALLCVGGFALLVYFEVGKEGMENAQKEGAEFGKTTDNMGCQSKGVEMSKPIAFTDIRGTLRVQYFTEGCLPASRPSPNFCDGLPTERSDMFNRDRAKDAECEKYGLRESLPCRAAIRARLEFCEKRR